MGRRLILFWDTPLLLRRLAAGSPGPEEPEAEFRTGILNLFETVHLLMRRGHTKVAEVAYERFSSVAEALTRDRIFAASRLRIRLHDRGLSYADAVGYVTSRELGALFVTTDRAFRGLPSVRIEEVEGKRES